jgi:hypothetical protein
MTDAKASSDGTVQSSPCTNDPGVLATHAPCLAVISSACDREVRRPLATAESATAVAATTKAAAIKTMAANAPTDPQTPLGFRGIAPSVTCDPECAADGMSTAAQEMNGGLSWELAVLA